MIEDPKLTLDILKYFADDNVGFPAHVDSNDLLDSYPQINKETLDYHLMCAIDNELLVGEYKIVTAFERSSLQIGILEGLTPKGGDYVRDSDSNLWEKARQSLTDKGIAVTTSRLVDSIAHLVQNSFSSTS